jgi:hypothetical protein
MDEAIKSKKLSLGAFIGGLVTLVTLTGGVLAIKQYIDQNPVDINGMWVVEDWTENSSDSRYKNMKLTYTAVFVQNGNSFTGTGEKTGEQDAGESLRELVGTERTRISIKGSITGNSIHANVVEYGKERKSDGEFEWQFKNGTWVGTFSSMAADSSGSSTLKRQSSTR